jgi:IMP dehydrogenase
MDSVISPTLADILRKKGSIPIYHRFYDKPITIPGIVSIGVNNLARLGDRLENIPNIRGICIDVAHGHTIMVENAIKIVHKVRPDLQVIAGAVCTAAGYIDLVNAGADAVRVGIGPGAACTTRMVTGFGIPQFTAIQECYSTSKHYNIPIIADGGIRNSRDAVLALAAGASCVMIGKLLALTKESAAEKQNREGKLLCPPNRGKLYANYRGQASKAYQEDVYGELKEGTVAEGVDFWAPVSGSANDVIDNLVAGIRSGLTWGGSSTIEEMQSKAEFWEVTPTYMTESRYRDE